MLILLVTLIAIAPAGAQVPLLTRFSDQPTDAGTPQGWSIVTFRNKPRQTRYELVRDGEAVVIRAQAAASAAALVHKLDIPLQQAAVLHWRWKIARLLDKSDIGRKSGDDYPARVYVTFALDPRASWAERIKYRTARLIYGNELPFSALNYVWDTHAPVGTSVGNAYTERVRMLVLESGAARLGEWVEERRDIQADYRRAFGREAPPITGVAIMTDTDDTGETATAWYGDIALQPLAH